MAPQLQYTAHQVAKYLERIQLPPSEHASDPLLLLTQLVQKQLAHIPFETLALHYSTDKVVSLNLEDVYEKLVPKCRGGYCLENNALFGAILRSMGFRVMSVICRITMAFRGVLDGSWLPMSHMANLVTIGGHRYLVDVGYGVDGPCTPVPLVSGAIRNGLPDQELKLEYKGLPQYQDPNQRVWMLSHRRASKDWEDVYHFPDIEFLPGDYDVLNDHVMARSIWATTVLAQKFILGDDGFTLTGNLLLVRDELKSGNCPAKQMTILRKLESEEVRLAVLREHFGINLTEEEKEAIRNRPTELKNA